MVEIREAIHAINSAAEFSYQNEDINTIEWNKNTTPISKADIEAKQTELQAAYDALAYARTRKQEYPNVDEFMEAYTEKEIGGNSSKWDEYVIKYNKVRSDNPKL
jgi:hypothetical protein|tara:strand:+ start:996 stop:1310 length:315 start_codon:yes stop_codon:yes gene_type:complete